MCVSVSRLYASSKRLSLLICYTFNSFVSAMDVESSSSDSLNLKSFLSVEELCDWLGKKESFSREQIYNASSWGGH